MNAYELDIWRSIKHNSKFVINDRRTVVIHAINPAEAKKKLKLAEAKTNKLDGLLIEVSAEFVYGYDKIGTVRIEPFYVYSNGRTPISVEDFKRRQHG